MSSPYLDARATLMSGKPIADTVAVMVSTYGNTIANVAATGLNSGLAGIAVEYDANGLPVYRAAADNRRNGAANGY